MPLEILTCEQGSPEWFKARAGLVTMSEAATVLAKKGRGSAESLTRRKYMLRLAGERLIGEVEDTYTNAHMERGKLMEADARRLYAFAHDAEPELIGFARNGQKGCSPDALLASDGVLEIKTAIPSVLIDKLLRNEFPPEHKPQCQGALWVCEREWIDLCIFWPGLPLFVKRAYRESAYIATLSAAVDAFNAELADVVEKVRRYTGEPRDELRHALTASLAMESTEHA